METIILFCTFFICLFLFETVKALRRTAIAIENIHIRVHLEMEKNRMNLEER